VVVLSKQEKRDLSDSLANHLPKIRKILGVTQAEFGELCGFSRTRVSQIENGAIKMTWSQCTSILFICTLNRTTSEYLFVNGIYTVRALQFFQSKDENMPPELDIMVRREIMEKALYANSAL